MIPARGRELTAQTPDDCRDARDIDAPMPLNVRDAPRSRAKTSY